MESIIKESLKKESKRENKKQEQQKHPRNEKEKEIQALLNSHKTNIKVVGCGGAGNNTLSRLMEIGVKDVVAVAANTDAQDLLYAEADEKILIGRDITNGLGAGSNPEIGEKSAQETREEIEEILQGTDLVFVTCGLGGGTGTGSAPVIAEIARSLGALTISVVTVPFTEEGVMRWENAHWGLAKLEQHSDTVIVVQNDKLLEIVPDMPLNQAFKVADEILVNAVKGITELVTEKGLVNLDFADIRAVMKEGGTAMIGLGESVSANKATEAVEMAVQNPLLDVDITGARSALINITGGSDMSLKDARIVMRAVAEKLDPAARVIWGARMDSSMQENLRVMLIVTGLRNTSRKSRDEIEQRIASSPQEPVASPETVHGCTTSPGAEQEQGDDDQADKPVFNKIFEEETQADLAILQSSVAALEPAELNEQAMRDIRTACTALSNSAQLFAFNHISYFADALEQFVAAHISAGRAFSEEAIELLKDSVVVMQGMIYENPEAVQESREIVDKITAQGNGQEAPADDEFSEGDLAEPEFLAVQDVENDDDLMDDFVEQRGKKGKVGDMVNYVKHLLGEERDDRKE
ncbi:MAG TPA: cell division protein FtsZ [Bacteroidetes bacterium]|nr:cell division protein FtsZ [Bacteroidota bacterium]